MICARRESGPTTSNSLPYFLLLLWRRELAGRHPVFSTLMPEAEFSGHHHPQFRSF
jgi:hypothetical protein